ncbi:galactose oxidase [Pedobacter frigiditerrae]|uniref:galactose oxidase n=1 Tax=Pedobacter frigiditerrae TaxID=2530452 RepID=UPI00292E3384|nr:galactose oxidase [Pedobacter frigiditerrae]
MQYLKILLLIMLTSTITFSDAQTLNKNQSFTWGELPAIPDKFGFAGSFSGVTGGALIVAGGANFPDGGAPWTGSKKVWTDKVFALDKTDGEWKLVGKLPEPMGYGVAVSIDGKMICVGGSNELGHSAKVYAISYHKGELHIEKLRDLPQPLANMSGALVKGKLYIAGGLAKPDAQEAASVFYNIDLAKGNKATWNVLETWPGEPRMLAVAGSCSGKFYLFSGTNLFKNAAGELERKYLTDAFSYEPGKGWKKLTSLPKAVVAAPGPAYANGNSLLVFGGDDGSLAKQAAGLKEKHPGFSDQILAFNVKTKQWSVAGKIHKEIKADASSNPNGSIWPAVTSSLVMWNNLLVFPSGEVRPAIRTPRVITVTIHQ